MNILVNFATRSRPAKFLNCIQNLLDTANEPLTILVKADTDDDTMLGIEEVLEQTVFAWQQENPNKKTSDIIFKWGTSKNKIDAINRDIDVPFDILVNFSDDMLAVKNGWDDVLRENFKNYGLTLCAHYPDQNAYKQNLIALSIMGKQLYDFLGYVYHPSYISLWCDNEFKDVCEILGCYVYFGGPKHDNMLFHHNHPAHSPEVEMDEQYKHTESYYDVDAINYKNRKKNNFGLTAEMIRQFNQ